MSNSIRLKAMSMRYPVTRVPGTEDVRGWECVRVELPEGSVEILHCESAPCAFVPDVKGQNGMNWPVSINRPADEFFRSIRKIAFGNPGPARRGHTGRHAVNVRLI